MPGSLQINKHVNVAVAVVGDFLRYFFVIRVKKLHARELSRKQSILRFDIILQHDWVFFRRKTKSPCFDLFIHGLIRQIENTYRNHFSRSYKIRSIKIMGFAGKPFLLSPPTPSHSSFLLSSQLSLRTHATALATQTKSSGWRMRQNVIKLLAVIRITEALNSVFFFKR